MSEEIRSVLVAGGGQMGSGIAQVAAQAGCEVLLYDVDEERIQKAILSIGNHLAGSVTKAACRRSSERRCCLESEAATSLRRPVRWIVSIEAVTEQLAVKKSLFRELDTICAAQTILATNTSSLSVTELAAGNRAPRSSCRAAFHESSPGDEACRAY